MEQIENTLVEFARIAGHPPGSTRVLAVKTDMSGDLPYNVVATFGYRGRGKGLAGKSEE
jgi:hypothetical protein